MAFSMCSSASLLPVIMAVIKGVFPEAFFTEILAPLQSIKKHSYTIVIVLTCEKHIKAYLQILLATNSLRNF